LILNKRIPVLRCQFYLECLNYLVDIDFLRPMPNINLWIPNCLAKLTKIRRPDQKLRRWEKNWRFEPAFWTRQIFLNCWYLTLTKNHFLFCLLLTVESYVPILYNCFKSCCFAMFTSDFSILMDHRPNSWRNYFATFSTRQKLLGRVLVLILFY
jgi:hypothetical protein